MLASLASLCWGVKVAVLLKEQDACLVVRQDPTNSSAVLCSCGKADVLHKIALSPIVLWLLLASAAVLQPVSLQQLTCCGHSGGLGDLCVCVLGRSAGDQRNWEEVFWKLRVEQKKKCHLPLLVPEVRASRLLMHLQSRSYSDVTEYLRMGIPQL